MLFLYLKAAWFTGFSQELARRPRSSPLEIIFYYSPRLGSFSTAEYKDFSTSKLVTEQDITGVMMTLREATEGMDPATQCSKRCLSTSTIILVNLIGLLVVILKKVMTGELMPIANILIILSLCFVFSILLQAALGRYFSNKESEMMLRWKDNIQRALDYHNKRLFSRLGYTWEMSEKGSYVILTVSLSRVQGNLGRSEAKGADGQEIELSVINEESTYRGSVGATTTLRTGRNVGSVVTTNTSRQTKDRIEELGSEEEEGEEEKQSDKKATSGVNGGLDESGAEGDTARSKWDDFGDVLMSTERKFGKK